MRVKICGITSVEDAIIASKYGADAIGMLLGLRHKSEDEITIEEAESIIAAIPLFVTPVMVTHLTNHGEILEYLEALRITTVQLHDEISVNEILTLKERAPYLKIIKTVHVTGKDSLAKAKKYEKLVDAIELDSINLEEDRIGGTGIVHDWNISQRIVSELRVPVILAGGLTPENVEHAIKIVRPYGVDVNTGVKVSRDGRRKDPKRLKNFIEKAKKTFLEIDINDFAKR